MKNCLKCGFENHLADSEACPKCGAVYAKVERIKREKKKIAEKAANGKAFAAKAAKQMEEEVVYQEKFSRVFGEEVHLWERDQYSYVDYLTGTFIFFAIIFAIVEVLGGLWLYRFTQQSSMLMPQDQVLFIIIYACYFLISMAILLSFPAILKMLKDTANNSRISSEFLRELLMKQENL